MVPAYHPAGGNGLTRQQHGLDWLSEGSCDPSSTARQASRDAARA